jgi:hypothetical protein
MWEDEKQQHFIQNEFIGDDVSIDSLLSREAENCDKLVIEKPVYVDAHFVDSFAKLKKADGIS